MISPLTYFMLRVFFFCRTWKQPGCPLADKWIHKLWYIDTMVYYSAIKKKEHIWVNSNEVDETGAYYTEWSKSEKETPMQYINAYIQNSKDGNDDPIWKTAKETQMYRTDFWTLWENARVGWSERIALKHVYYHVWNGSPVQVQCVTQGAQGTLRDGIGREVRGWFRMGNTCKPMADSCQGMAKTTRIL